MICIALHFNTPHRGCSNIFTVANVKRATFELQIYNSFSRNANIFMVFLNQFRKSP